jgi:hypothetical protein
MRPASPIPFWRTKDFPWPLNKYELRCTASIQEEIIASFDFYAEIKDLGKELLKGNQHPNPAKSFQRFQAYIRQAKTFYETAAILHHRASPLNYYYAFMNLAKALIFVQTPSFVDQNLRHGIAFTPKQGSLRNQRVRTMETGVFPSFYAAATKVKLAKSSFKIVDLLSYVSDVEFEYTNLKYGTSSSFRTKLAMCVDANKTNGFPMLAVLMASANNFKSIEKKLTISFDEVVIPSQTLKSLFDVPAEHTTMYRFFEGQQIPINTPMYSTLKGVSDFICQNPFADEFLFTLNCPIRSPRLVAMNEMLAIYVVMFSLGSLVRYRPDFLEGLLSTKDAWILERFIKTAPLTFLRHARNMLDNQYLVYATR